MSQRQTDPARILKPEGSQATGSAPESISSLSLSRLQEIRQREQADILAAISMTFFGSGRCSGHDQFNGRYCRDVAGPERWCIHCAGLWLLDQVASVSAALASKDREIERLRAALTNYGEHTFTCGFVVNPSGQIENCTCGFFSAALATCQTAQDDARIRASALSDAGERQDLREVPDRKGSE